MNLSRRTIIFAFLVTVSLLAAGVWRYGYLQALDQLAQRAEADLALASDRLSTQLQVYQELAVLTADHPGLTELDYPMRRAGAQALLLDIADKTGALDVAFVGPDGIVMAAARGEIGTDLGDQSFFQRAMQGALGSGHGLVGGQARRAFFYAAPAFAVDGHVRGVLIMVADVEDVEQTWHGTTPSVFFMDKKGEVFISNRSELLFWSRREGAVGLEPGDGSSAPIQASRIGGHDIWTLNWGPYLPRQALHLLRDLPVIGMTGEVLLDVAPARRLAGSQAAAVAAICLAFGALLFLATERRRTLAQANAVLESRVQARTQALLETNTQLRREVTERQDAEAALTQAQADLVQAGKLSALGQMSAGISHELNQPLMAIRQFADNGSEFLDRGNAVIARENLGRIAELAGRAGRIIKNLRSFARNEHEPMGKVDLGQVISTSVELTDVRLRDEGVLLDWTPPVAPVLAWGGEVRLVQVFVNLINNAADAMIGQSEKSIVITVHAGDRLTVTVRDTGPGIEDPEKIFEPFYTTKPVGSSEGMGLGLSISYGLVQSFGGNIRGADTGGHGALFTIELDYFDKEQGA